MVTGICPPPMKYFSFTIAGQNAVLFGGYTGICGAMYSNSVYIFNLSSKVNNIGEVCGVCVSA